MAYLSIGGIALIARMIYLAQIRHAPAFALLMGDGLIYDRWASRIASGDWLGTGVFYQAPLYPYFLGALYALFGRNLLAVRLAQIVVGAGSCVLLARAGRSFFNQATGLLAGVFLALHPTAIFFDCSIQKSVLDLFFVCVLLAALGRLSERPERRWWLGTGVVLGLLILTRENALVFPPIVLAWLLIHWRTELLATRLSWAGLLLLGLAAILLPVGCRNLLAGGEFHLTTAQFGPNFYIGNGRSATGLYKPLRVGRGNAMFERDDATAIAEQAAGRRLGPSEVSRYWTGRALDDIRADKSRWLRLMWRKWLLVWNVSEVGDTDDQYTYGDWSPLLQALNRLVNFGTVCPLAALGICLTWRQRRRLWLLDAMILGYAMSLALFYVFSRYRFPFVPMLLLLAAAGLTHLREAFRETRWPAIGTGAAAATVMALTCNRTMVPETLIRAGTHTSLGNAFLEGGKVHDGIEQYEQALRLEPNYPDAHINLAAALLEAGRFTEAVGQYEQALRIQPDDADAHNTLGVVLAQLGQPKLAIEHFQRALQIRPDYAEAHNNWGIVLKGLGQAPEAIQHYQRALQIRPGYAEAHNNLGVILKDSGRVPEAIEQYEQALAIRPDYAEAHYNLGVALEEVGRVQEAIEHFQQALRFRPGLSDARNRLARLRDRR